MSTCLIKAGSHYHQMPPFTSLPWIGERRIERYVTFGPGCEYDAIPYNADDVNKLVGLSFGFGGVHKNSARFGWRWSKSEQCIELLAYCYVNGERNWDEQLRFPVIAKVKLGERVLLCLNYHPKKDSTIRDGLFTFTAWQGDREKNLGLKMVDTIAELPKFGLTHGPFFGGELVAPHDMTIELERV